LQCQVSRDRGEQPAACWEGRGNVVRRLSGIGIDFGADVLLSGRDGAIALGLAISIFSNRPEGLKLIAKWCGQELLRLWCQHTDRDRYLNPILVRIGKANRDLQRTAGDIGEVAHDCPPESWIVRVKEKRSTQDFRASPSSYYRVLDRFAINTALNLAKPKNLTR
jgi:hypothetical protein